MEVIVVEVPPSPASEMIDVIASRMSERFSAISLSCLSSSPAVSLPPGDPGGEW